MQKKSCSCFKSISVRLGLGYTMGFPGGLGTRQPACNAGGLGSTPGPEKPPAEGNGYPLQCSCLENSMDRGAW